MLSPLAKRHFKLFRDPFVDDVNSPDDIYMSESQQYVVEAMIQTALVGGITAAIGESGSGKSTLRKLLQFRISRERQNIRIIFPQTFDKKKLNTVGIAAAILSDIEPDTPIRTKNEAVARQVREALLRSARGGNKHVLMIEEAHDLSIDTLKYLKRFNEVEAEDGFSRVLSIVLIAQPEMRKKLDIDRYYEAREFINRCEIATLEPLHQHLQGYLKHKFGRVGADASAVLADDAYDAIRARWTKVDRQTQAVHTNLYPLVVNNTVTRAMNRAAELGVPLITADLIKEL
jgi:type II secretory pathway predicted ATPase ExeA